MTSKRPSTESKTTNGPPGGLWLFDEPELDDEGLALLAAYRDAAEANRQTQREQTAPAGDASPEAATDDTGTPRVATSPTGVRRLDSVAGVPMERFSGLHGQLLAAGYLTADVVGRADGLSYRVTREGLRRLSGDTHAEAA